MLINVPWDANKYLTKSLNWNINNHSESKTLNYSSKVKTQNDQILTYGTISLSQLKCCIHYANKCRNYIEYLVLCWTLTSESWLLKMSPAQTSLAHKVSCLWNPVTWKTWLYMGGMTSEFTDLYDSLPIVFFCHPTWESLYNCISCIK